MNLKEVIAPPYLSRVEQIARGLIVVGAVTGAIAGGFGIKNEVEGMHADDKADTAETYQAESAAHHEAADSYNDAIDLFYTAGGSFSLALLGGWIRLRRSEKDLKRLESYLEESNQ